jgi:UPF0271 protein
MMQPVGRSIDINADVGEEAGHDAGLMPLISSANIACGGHVGDDATIATTVALARLHGVGIGAHPGHADRESFGRREISVTPEDAAALVVAQVARLEAIAVETPRHVKLHGALYHQVARDADLAAAVAEAIADRWPGMRLIAPVGSPLVDVARAFGLAVSQEAFVDRGYAPDGTLLPRSLPGAAITDPNEAATRAVQLACAGTVTAVDGTRLVITPDTLCIHGDGPNPVAVAQAIRTALAAAGIAIRV